MTTTSPFRPGATLDAINAQGPGTLIEHLGIRMTDLGTDSLSGSMPVDHRTRQPYGLLHGGASVALAETLGSVAANLCIDNATHIAVGLEINANHLLAATHGHVHGTATAVHIGRSTQVWDIRIHDDQGRPTCVSRLTMAVVPRRAAG